jgi:hypothetical protein
VEKLLVLDLLKAADGPDVSTMLLDFNSWAIAAPQSQRTKIALQKTNRRDERNYASPVEWAFLAAGEAGLQHWMYRRLTNSWAFAPPSNLKRKAMKILR